MKRFFMLLTVLACVCVSALGYNLNTVVDSADLLSDSEETALLQKCENLYAAHDFQLVFHTTYGTDGQPIHLYAADFYDYNGYGYGADCDGIIFVVDMQEREYVTVTTGKGINYFSDYTISAIEDGIVSDLSEGEFYDAFLDYADSVENQLAYVKKQSEVIDDQPVYEFDYVQAYDYYGDYVTSGEKLMIAAVIALVITGIVLGVMVASMKTARKKNQAADYVQDVNLTRVSDVYLYTTERRRKIQTSSSSGNGGSSTFRGSSGTSHGGGRAGKF
ncbi:MAG: TPM domain-containing protein [Clostridiales bacterium]|nr:TPM domain-containing protein [Clostridiales bacterium]